MALYDYWWIRRKEKDLPQPFSPTIFNAVKLSLSRGRLRYIYVALLTSWGSYLSVSALSSIDTTYICPTSLPRGNFVPRYQWLGVLLDCLILHAAEQVLLFGPDDRHGNRPRGAVAWGWILLVSRFSSRSRILRSMVLINCIQVCAAIWSLIGAIGYHFKPEWRAWLVSWEPEYVRSVSWLSVLFALLILGASRSVSLHWEIPCAASDVSAPATRSRGPKFVFCYGIHFREPSFQHFLSLSIPSSTFGLDSRGNHHVIHRIRTI